MFQIKICGVTTVESARVVVDADADAIGLNFYAGSKRCVDENVAATIARELPASIARVGVFVNHEPEELRRIADSIELDWIQLHGDEPPSMIEQLADRRVIKAFRCREGDASLVTDYLADCRRLPDAILIDAYEPGAYGGTGRVVDWDACRELALGFTDIPLILAGGLHAGNIGTAIATARPSAVDTASGVESSPGIKDAVRTRAFVDHARVAFGDV